MNSGHAPAEMLAEYVGGALADGMSLLVASHLTFCPSCRAAVRLLDDLGGALLAAVDAATPGPDCLAGALARIAHEPVATTPPAVAEDAAEDPGTPLPAPLRARIGAGMADVRWRRSLPGLFEHRLEGFAGEEVKLLRAHPGAPILRHTHVGDEATLVLAGRMRDGDRIYARGEIALAGATEQHQPQIPGPDACLCLVVTSDPLRFAGPLGAS